MIDDSDWNTYLCHDTGCNCKVCSKVIEYLSTTTEGLNALQLVESKPLMLLDREMLKKVLSARDSR